MKRLILSFVFASVLMLWAIPVFAQNGNGGEFEFPQWLMIVLGSFAPTIIRKINENITGETLRFIVSVLVVVVTAFIGMVATGNWNTSSLQDFCLIAFAFSQFAYRLVWKPLFDQKQLARKKVTDIK